MALLSVCVVCPDWTNVFQWIFIPSQVLTFRFVLTFFLGVFVEEYLFQKNGSILFTIQKFRAKSKKKF